MIHLIFFRSTHPRSQTASEEFRDPFANISQEA